MITANLQNSMKILSETIQFHFRVIWKNLQRYRKNGNAGSCENRAVGQIGGVRTVVGVLDNRFLMGSMGVAVGEKITRAVGMRSRTGFRLSHSAQAAGARMQEEFIL